ncbi:uncharacterized protein LOC5516493 isoform X2 [Nematostella vectensis]|uniref:uncharacterized protein LOC5516493 isoform X2 n=1 Tax=Nematostella vectensis TaxID=45351 RepID=UPI0020774223|nr:uncharacterized protein LOC5516493 isoform X2 [Nematostella vectensis]
MSFISFLGCRGTAKAINLKKVTPTRAPLGPSAHPNMPRNKIGLALSGGGVRSAAFSSGVLRRLLQKSIEIDYISCISGGNFTAAAFLDWKSRNRQEDEHEWHHEFFENMRRRIGYFCDWRNACRGIHDFVIVLLLMLFVNLLIPIVLWGGLSIPVAYVIDLVLGGTLRIGFQCGNTTTVRECGTTFNANDREAFKVAFLFIFLAVGYLFFYLLKKIIKRICNTIRFIQISTGILLGLSVLPWFLQQYSQSAPLWLKVLILGLSMFFWCGFPPLRNVSALAIVFYIYAYVIKWRVYRSDFPIHYSESHFYTAMLIAGAILWVSPYLGVFSRTSIYNYVKWRLQYAFFTKESVGRYGCSGITCTDFFPVLSPLLHCSRCQATNDKTLTLASLAGMRPQYISNVVADYWRIRKLGDPDEPPEAMISLSSTEIEVITEQPGSGTDAIQCSLLPEHIKLADAMTTAALVVRPPREQDKQFEPFRELQIILGLANNNAVPTAPMENYGCTNDKLAKVMPILLQSIAGAPIILLAVLWLTAERLDYSTSDVEKVLMIVFIAYVLIFAAIAMLPTGSEGGWFGEEIVRWCHVNLYHVRFLREFLNINNVGPRPPALISLSDLGRVEKFGLLSLFKRRVKKIVTVDGSYIQKDDDYAIQIIRSMELARKYFNCEFIGYDCRDVIGEIYKKYINTPAERRPRSYRFIVKYFDKTENGYVEAGKGEVLLLSPRHPDRGVPFPESSSVDMTWGEYARDTSKNLDPKRWGPGPVLKAEEVDRLTFCCCECCHSSSKAIQWVSKKLCNGFPHHSTVNQFFTPSMFSAYHREGYRACIEADIESFLADAHV